MSSSVIENDLETTGALFYVRDIQKMRRRVDLASSLVVNPQYIPTLAADPLYLVRQAIARRADLNKELISALAKDSDLFVRQTIASRIDLPKVFLIDLALDPSDYVRHKIASRRTLPLVLILFLACDSSPHVRATLKDLHRNSIKDETIKQLKAQNSRDINRALIALELESQQQ